MARCLVTGATGFLGSHVARAPALAEAGAAGRRLIELREWLTP